MMKFNAIRWIVCLLMLSVLFACERSEDGAPSTEEQIAGSWTIVSSNTTVSVPLVTIPEEDIDNFDPTANIEGETITFNQNGTFTIGEGSTEQEGTWTVSDNGNTIVFDGLAQGDVTTAVDAQTLNSLQTFEIAVLNSNMMTLQNSTDVPIPEELIEALTGTELPDGIQIDAVVGLNINLEKQ